MISKTNYRETRQGRPINVPNSLLAALVAQLDLGLPREALRALAGDGRALADMNNHLLTTFPPLPMNRSMAHGHPSIALVPSIMVPALRIGIIAAPGLRMMVLVLGVLRSGIPVAVSLGLGVGVGDS